MSIKRNPWLRSESVLEKVQKNWPTVRGARKKERTADYRQRPRNRRVKASFDVVETRIKFRIHKSAPPPLFVCGPPPAPPPPPPPPPCPAHFQNASAASHCDVEKCRHHFVSHKLCTLIQFHRPRCNNCS